MTLKLRCTLLKTIRYLNFKGLKVGDNITFEFADYKIKKKIRGIGYSPEYVYHASTSSVIRILPKSVLPICHIRHFQRIMFRIMF